MKPVLQLYTRKDCCLCADMKEILRQMAERYALAVEEIDVDACAELRREYGHEVPVLFVHGRKAAKYRTTVRELEKKLRRIGALESRDVGGSRVA